MDIFDLIIIGLAVQRLTVMWMQPNGLFEPLRSRAAKIHTLLMLGASCPLCVSMWASFILLGAYSFLYGKYFVYALATAALASAVNAWNRGA